MYLEVNKETTAELKGLGEDLIILLNRMLNFFILLGLTLIKWAMNTLQSLTVFSFNSIKEKGLKEILYERAMHFFKLEEIHPKTHYKKKYSGKKKTSVYINRKPILRLILLPVYLVLVLLVRKRNKYYKIKKNYFKSP
jgi:hypothetical protein